MTVDQLQKKWGADLAIFTRGEMCKDILSTIRNTAPCFNVAGTTEVEIHNFSQQRFASLKTGEDILKRLSGIGEPQDGDGGETVAESYPDDFEEFLNSKKK